MEKPRVRVYTDYKSPVPTMVFNGELFWGGDRIDMLIERIKDPESAAAALGSRHGA